MKLLLVACLCMYACVSAESGGEANEANPKLLANFRNFEACLDNFDIHKDKIIRTEDSRAMGAKYISESDMNTREECLRLCCVTDTCDVFVFEEKRPGSCYLFNCGSAADFKCKFTKHHNYTSGVLTLDHQMNIALDPNSPSKHEQELNQLRRPEGTSVMSSNLTSGATSQPQLPLQGMVHKSNKSMDQGPVKMQHCSRFQFKCRTSGECIAIYNACDGIPQCSDGSDESPELGCPTPVTSSLIPIVVSSGNKSDQEDSLPKLYENPYHLRPQKIPLPDKLENVEAEIQSEQTMVSGHSDSASEHSHRIQIPLSSSNILKQPEMSHIPEYQTVHQQARFKKPDEPSEINSSPEFSGFRQYLNPHREQDSEKTDEEDHNYIAVKLLAERNKDAEHSAYNHKSQDLNLQSHIKSSFLQSQADIPDVNRHSEHIALFQTAEHSTRTHKPTQIDLKQQQQQQQQQHLQLQQQSGLANALRHQLTNMHLSEMQPEVFQKEPTETKETKFSFRNQAHSPHATRMGPQNANIDKAGAQSEVHVEVDNEHQLRSDLKEQLEVSYQEPPLQDVPDRSYKYEDEDRHIFNHKGYGLVAESDSSEIPYKIAVPNVQYKVNSAASSGFMNNMEYGNKLQRNMWTEQIRPTSHELKILKNTAQPVDTVDNGYPLPSDYMYDEGQHSILNAVSLIPHRPNSDHNLPTLRASTGHVGGSLERTSLSRGSPSHRDLSHDIVSNSMVSNNAKPNANEPDVSAKHENSSYKKGKQKSTYAAVTTTSDTAEVTKDKHEENHHEHFVSLQQAYISEIPNDQQQDRPSGALLSMSFGLCITFVMVVLVACRLRVVKRRLRRNGKSLYAHDADYLVNGMYL